MRGVWIVACIVSAIGGTMFAAFCAFAIYEASEQGGSIPNLWPHMLTSGGVAAASIVGLFRRRAEIERDMQDEPVQPAPWIEEMRERQERDKT
jgi:hypothetical protein